MQKQEHVLRVVIACPGDVQPERDCLPEVIEELNRGTAADYGLQLRLIHWQTDSYPGFHPEGSQGQIEVGLDIEHSDVLIGIFWKKFGTPVKGAKSGTEHEFRKAYEIWQNKKQPHIMMYFSERPYAPKSKAEIDQWKKVINFKEKFPKEGLWWSFTETTEFQKLVRSHLTQYIRNRGRPIRVEVSGIWPPPPPRPGLCVGRNEVLKELKRRFGIGQPNYVSGQMQPITALLGMGGIGKTTVAAAIAYDPEIQKAFPDGVLWAALGKQPTLVSLFAAWGRRFKSEGEQLARASRLTAAQEDLAELLRNRRMLLILDDVWEVEHVAAFEKVRSGSEGCALVITMRELQPVLGLPGKSEWVYNLPGLTTEGGLELLRELAKSVVDRYPEKCRELVEALKGLPLALQVAGRLLSEKASARSGGLEELLSELREGEKLLEAKAPADRMDYEKETIPTVAALLKQSTDRLDTTSRNRFALLGASSKNARFRLDTLKRLWQVDDPTDTVDALVRHGLLEPIGEGDYQMHGLLVSLASSLRWSSTTA
jgi:predicted ATPase